MFFCEFCEISKDTFSYRTPPVAASYFLARVNREILCSFEEYLVTEIISNKENCFLKRLCRSPSQSHDQLHVSKFNVPLYNINLNHGKKKSIIKKRSSNWTILEKTSISLGGDKQEAWFWYHQFILIFYSVLSCNSLRIFDFPH